MSSALGIEWLELSPEKLVARMPVNENTKQPFGLLHGGASVALAESLASVGGWLNIDETMYASVGLEINANHLRSVKEGFVIGEAKPFHIGKKTQVWSVEIRTEEGKMVCVSRCTLAIIKQERGSEG